MAELKAIATAAARRWDVSLPMHLMSHRYDVSIRKDMDEGWVKLQVKRAWYDARQKTYRADITDGKKKEYEFGAVDYFFIWAAEIDQWWLIPAEDVQGKKDLRIGSSKYNVYILGAEDGI